MAEENSSKVLFNVDLFCTETNLTSSHTVSFPGLPQTVLNIKEKVEGLFSIPVCIQSLYYCTSDTKDHLLGDGHTLEHLRARSGDTFVVKYSSKADCEDVQEIVSWFSDVRTHLSEEKPTIFRPINKTFDDVLKLGHEKQYFKKLCYNFFFPWQNARTYANKLHFIHCGGLDVLMGVYKDILELEWEECILKLKQMEQQILSTLWNLAETQELRRLIFAHKSGGIDLCKKSLLRKKVENNIEDYTEVTSHRARLVLINCIGSALGLICNMCGLPESVTRVGCDEACLEQLTCFSLCPTVTSTYSLQLVATIFTRVAYNPVTHPFLAKPLLVTRLLTACDRGCTLFSMDSPDTLLLRYFTQLFLAQVIIASPQCVSMEIKHHIKDFMESFLKDASYQVIMKRELRQSYVWYTLLPYIKLLYVPNLHVPTEDEVLQHLHMLSVQTVLLSLQNMLSRDDHREVLLKERLEDYITCSPAYVPATLRDQAKGLVLIIRSGVQLQPPRLLNLVRAKLAKMQFGLSDIISLTVGEIVAAMS